jgi:hypothetical protein
MDFKPTQDIVSQLLEKNEKRYHLTLTKAEAYMLGCLFSLGSEQMRGDIENQDFFIRAIASLVEVNPSSVRSIGVKMLELVSSLDT